MRQQSVVTPFPVTVLFAWCGRDNVLEVIKGVRNFNPTKQSLDAVSTPALALTDCMDKLSTGWGNGLLGFCAFCFSMCVSQLALMLSSEWCAGADQHQQAMAVLGSWRNNLMFFVVVLALMPLLLAVDLATTSSLCDQLLEELNSAGIRHGVEHYPTIDWILQSLERLNARQGLVSLAQTYILIILAHVLY